MSRIDEANEETPFRADHELQIRSSQSFVERVAGRLKVFLNWIFFKQSQHQGFVNTWGILTWLLFFLYKISFLKMISSCNYTFLQGLELINRIVEIFSINNFKQVSLNWLSCELFKHDRLQDYFCKIIMHCFDKCTYSKFLLYLRL